MKLRFIALIVLPIMLYCNSRTDPKAQFLVVGETSYTREEAESILRSYPIAVRRVYTKQDGSFDLERFRDFMIREIGFVEAARKSHTDEDPTVAVMMKWAANRILSQSYVRDRLYSKVIPPEEIEKLYREKRDASTLPERFHARMILVTPSPNPILYSTSGDDAKTPEEARVKVDRILEALKSRPFDEVAREWSEDRAAPSGGDPGWLSADALDPEFAEVLRSMKPGEIRGPVETGFGLYIIQLIEHAPARTRSLESMRLDLLQEAASRHSAEIDQAMEEEIARRKESGEIRTP